jgi:hypothetical protein
MAGNANTPAAELEPLKDHVTYRDEDVLVPLTDPEKGQRGIRIGELTRHLSAIESERASAVRGYNVKLKEKKGAIEEISRELEEGVSKKMKVRTTYSFKENMVRRHVDATGELLGERKMNDMDRQLELSLRPKPKLEVADNTVDLEKKKAAEKK